MFGYASDAVVSALRGSVFIPGPADTHHRLVTPHYGAEVL